MDEIVAIEEQRLAGVLCERIGEAIAVVEAGGVIALAILAICLAADLGLLGSSIHGYGCAGLNGVSYGLICQELERGDSGLRSFVSVQSSLCMYPIYAFGSEEQKQRWLPRMAKGEVIGCFGLTEPHGGSDPANMKTHARKQGKDWVLNGAKMWITNGTVADVAVVWAKLDGVVRGFLVEKGTPGFTAPEMRGKHSLRASITSELIFQDCEIPADAILPNVEGLRIFLAGQPGVTVRAVEVTEDGRVPDGFAGSPTVLINGHNPFRGEPVDSPACALSPPTVAELAAELDRRRVP